MRIVQTHTVIRGRVTERRRERPGRLSPETEATVDLRNREHPVLSVLWQVQVSHYVEKVRWALDYKRIPHVRRSLLPGLHAVKAKRHLPDAWREFVDSLAQRPGGQRVATP